MGAKSDATLVNVRLSVHLHVAQAHAGRDTVGEEGVEEGRVSSSSGRRSSPCGREREHADSNCVR